MPQNQIHMNEDCEVVRPDDLAYELAERPLHDPQPVDDSIYSDDLMLDALCKVHRIQDFLHAVIRQLRRWPENAKPYLAVLEELHDLVEDRDD